MTDMLRTKALDMDLGAGRHTLAFPELQSELIKMFGILVVPLGRGSNKKKKKSREFSLTGGGG